VVQSADVKCKTDKIPAPFAAGDRIGALRIAARFFDRSADTLTFKRGHGRAQQSWFLPAAREGT
jgi:hypothetical protein